MDSDHVVDLKETVHGTKRRHKLYVAPEQSPISHSTFRIPAFAPLVLALALDLPLRAWKAPTLCVVLSHFAFHAPTLQK